MPIPSAESLVKDLKIKEITIVISVLSKREVIAIKFLYISYLLNVKLDVSNLSIMKFIKNFNYKTKI